ncbi:hypothetical protein DXG01_003351 [Tephrocybe rancida]|nr:hypothetical protein DXG01_003351 [Tephrocybe rancida]
MACISSLWFTLYCWEAERHSNWVYSSAPAAAVPASSYMPGTEKTLAIRHPKEKCADEIPVGWLDHLILTAEVIRDAGALMPFPYVKFAASIALQVLLQIQTVHKNKDDFLDLSRKLVEVIVTMRDTLCSCYQSHSPPPEFTSHCLNFVKYTVSQITRTINLTSFISKLLALQVKINEAVRRTKAWKAFLKSAEITKLIALYKEQVDDLRSNFTASDDQIPRHLAYTSNLLYFIDAMNDIVPVALDHCSSPTEFNEYVKFRFRKRVGRAIVERGYYSLCLQLVAGAQQLLSSNSEAWINLVKPGVTIIMDIVLKSESEDVGTDSRRCPSCRHLCNSASLGDEIKCPRCTTSFRVSRATIEEVNDDSALQIPTQEAFSPIRPLGIQGKSTDDCDVRYFRRFRVLMEALRESACVLVAEGHMNSPRIHIAKLSDRLSCFSDNPIARQLLVKQLQRLQLNVIATGNGEEALAEWEARGPGFFSAALFDHRKAVHRSEALLSVDMPSS